MTYTVYMKAARFAQFDAEAWAVAQAELPEEGIWDRRCDRRHMMLGYRVGIRSFQSKDRR